MSLTLPSPLGLPWATITERLFAASGRLDLAVVAAAIATYGAGGSLGVVLLSAFALELGRRVDRSVGCSPSVSSGIGQ